jgi:methyl acetate hydrolase
MTSRTAGARRIDEALEGAVARGEVPGVVAMAAGAEGPLYQGAFGVRSLAAPGAMTGDTLFRIASMTKAITSVAALQLVEEGRLALDAPVPEIGEAALNAPQVLDGFDAAGRPLLRPARRPITLKHLLTHTAGFTYEFWNAETARYIAASGTPSVLSGTLAAYRRPLNFDPGERWEYGINIDWVGRIVEALSGRPLDAHLRERIFAPLGMADTGFMPGPERQARQAGMHQRRPDGSLVPQPMPPLSTPEVFSGGGGLSSTAGDYLRFLGMLLDGGKGVLRPETIALMHQNHIGDLPAGVLKSTMPDLSNDVDFFPGAPVRWSLVHMLNLEPGPNGRASGTVGWGGLRNTYYWFDPACRVAGVVMTQILPFADPAVLRLYGAFERGVYALLA